MSAKKYVLSYLAVMYIFMALSLIFWSKVVQPAFNQRDLNRLGSLATTPSLTPEAKYSEHFTRFADYVKSGRRESFDVLTIGDSFSSGAYQDYLVNNYGLKIINAPLTGNCVEDLYMLCASGWLDEISPRVVILESVERGVQVRLGMEELDYPSGTDSRDITAKLRRKSGSSPYRLISPFTVQACIIYISHKLYHILNPEKLSPEVYITQLERKFFTNPGYESTLLHYCDDLVFMENPLDAEMVSRNLNNAARILKAKGIKLVFFAGVDKYDLYYPYILDKKDRPENHFFQKMRTVQGKEYIFVDSMKVLRQALAKGEQDIYWLGDTHWSWKGITYVCDEMVKYIIP